MGKLLLLSLIVMLAGCSTVSEQPQMPTAAGAKRALADENFLINSGNYPKLIALYKDKLKQAESTETRVKLAKAYLDTGDNESALFTIAPVITQPNASAESFYLQGLAQFNLGQASQSQRSLDVATHKAPNNAKYVNLLGAVQAELGQLEQARASFNRARSLLYDDIVIKNNLALVDIMEGNFQAAAARLMPVYRANPKGADEQLKANLAIIAAKLGSFETLKALYGDQYTDKELFGIFHGLRSSTYVSSPAGHSKADNRLLGTASETGDIQWQPSRSSHSDLATHNKPAASESSKEAAEAALVTTDIQVMEQTATAPATLAERAPQTNEYQKAPVAVSNTPSETPQNSGNNDSFGAPLMSLPDQGESLLAEPQPSSKVVPPSTQENRQTFESLVGIQRRYADDSTYSASQGTSASKMLSPEDIQTEYPAENQDRQPNLIEEASEDPLSAPVNVQWPLPASTLKPLSVRPTIEQNTLKEEASRKKTEPLVEPAKGHVTSQLSNAKPKKKWHFVALERYSLLSSDGFAIPVAQFRHAGQLIDVQQGE